MQLDKEIEKRVLFEETGKPYSLNLYAAMEAVATMRARGYQFTFKTLENNRWVVLLDEEEPIEDIPGILNDSFYINPDTTSENLATAICLGILNYLDAKEDEE